MSTAAPIPTEQDAAAVERARDTLYHALPPAQQALLDTIVAAGLALLSEGGDTAGYLNFADMRSAQEFMRRRAPAAADEAQPAPVEPEPARGRRWNLRPAVAWLRGDRT